ncbi:hypothetical protein L9F63_020265 [Diploptera punctata]|uniref:Nitrilase and fragile histidine triad fusion protein NitFhit n=1 Tax=Diploptera punctata TaxID=6984 RepID=A0AAD7ZSW4_DIPPU|nr:hypothetical protein L9F63_020265 [Diploptera punctata]
MASQKRIVAVCQMTARNDKQSNINVCSELVKTAKEMKAQMVFLPESCDFIGESKAETVASAEPLDGEMVQKFRHMAKENGVWLSLGGILEKVTDDKVHISHVVINNEGDVVSVYRKLHLFDVDIPEKNIRIMESDYALEGEEIVPPVDTPVGKLGLAICYDMRFPELSLTLTKAGAEVLAYPAAFTFATGAAHWEVLLRARAIETQCYVIAAAQTGSHNKKRSSWGHSMVVNPWGAIVAQCSEGKGVAVAEIDLSYLQQVRTMMPVWQHRRTDLYPSMLPIQSVGKPVPCNEQEEYKFGNTSVKADGVFYKTDKTLAFTNKRCVVPGHVLVIPLRCVYSLKELQPDEVSDLFGVVRRVQKVLRLVHGVDATSMGIQTGKEAGQTIEHLHVHILPRAEDALKKIKMDADERRDRTPEEMAEEASVLRKYFY